MYVIRITTTAIARCSKTTRNAFSFCERARRMLNTVIIKRPQMISTGTAISRGKNQIGITNVRAKTNLVRNVVIVASQRSFPV